MKKLSENGGSGVIWEIFGSYFGGQLGALGDRWELLWDPFGRSLEDNWEPFWELFGDILEHLGAIWSNIGSFWELWESFGGTLGDRLVLFGDIWGFFCMVWKFQDFSVTHT